MELAGARLEAEGGADDDEGRLRILRRRRRRQRARRRAEARVEERADDGGERAVAALEHARAHLEAGDGVHRGDEQLGRVASALGRPEQPLHRRPEQLGVAAEQEPQQPRAVVGGRRRRAAVAAVGARRRAAAIVGGGRGGGRRAEGHEQQALDEEGDGVRVEVLQQRAEEGGVRREHAARRARRHRRAARRRLGEQEAAGAAAPVLQLHRVERRRPLDEAPEQPHERRVRGDRLDRDVRGEQHRRREDELLPPPHVPRGDRRGVRRGELADQQPHGVRVGEERARALVPLELLAHPVDLRLEVLLPREEALLAQQRVLKLRARPRSARGRALTDCARPSAGGGGGGVLFGFSGVWRRRVAGMAAGAPPTAADGRRIAGRRTDNG